MNDDDLLTAVRDRFDPVRMDTPAAVIMARGRARRRRKNSGRLAAGALAVSLGAGLAVPALTARPAGTAGTAGTAGAAASPHQATLAAWTVQKHADGSVAVTIRRPENLRGLQLKLAKLGIAVIIVDQPAKLAHGCKVALPLKKLARPFTFVIRPAAIIAARTRTANTAEHRVLFIGAKPPGPHVAPIEIVVAACGAAHQA